MSETAIDYIGDELALFAAATNWKAYLLDSLGPYITGDVAEVGAGRGATTRALSLASGITSWLCIEPDPVMAGQLAGEVASLSAAYPVTIHHGVLADLPGGPRFDTVIYIDVLEHIQDDHAELRLVARYLRPGGRIVVLCPAWQFLYSPFDKAIGHFRRYNKATLRAVAAPSLVEQAGFYLDSVGMFASLTNKLALRQAMPTIKQVRMWDNWLVPASRLLDPVFGRWLGKSVVLVWTVARGD